MSDNNKHISEAVVNQYVGTLVWTATLSAVDEDGEPTSVELDGCEYDDGCALDDVPGSDTSDIIESHPEIFEEAREDLESFRQECLNKVGLDPFRFFDPLQVAHDFALSRNGHGAGFFDDPYAIRATGPRSSAATTYSNGEVSLSDELQEVACEMGACSISAWVEGGKLRMETHS